jgi:hypothetical protein
LPITLCPSTASGGVRRHFFFLGNQPTTTADAFGSVSHDLIKISLERFKFPPQIVSYFVNVYSQLYESVLTKDWRSENFRFEKGVFQGDSSSTIIF